MSGGRGEALASCNLPRVFFKDLDQGQSSRGVDLLAILAHLDGLVAVQGVAEVLALLKGSAPPVFPIGTARGRPSGLLADV